MRKIAICTLIQLVCLSAYAEKIKDVENYLNNIRTMQFDFIQHAQGKLRYGKMYLSKPYRIRWQYDKPKQALLIGNQKRYVYYEPRLQEVSYIPINRVHGSFLTYNTIKFGDNVKLVDQQIDHQQIVVALATDNIRTTRLYFQRQPLELKSFTVEDKEQQLQLHFEIQNLLINQPLEDKLFVFINPHIFRR